MSKTDDAKSKKVQDAQDTLTNAMNRANERCPHCDACPHCGARPQPQIVPMPYPQPYPVYPQPYRPWPSYPNGTWPRPNRYYPSWTAGGTSLGAAINPYSNAVGQYDA